LSFLGVDHGRFTVDAGECVELVSWIERYFRNARAPIIYEGTTQIHKMMQAEHALGFRKLNGKGGEASPLCSWAPALSPVHTGA
jgi:hypothetical protein